MNELREKIVRLPCSLDIDQVNEVCKATVTWFQQAIEGLKPLKPEQIKEIWESWPNDKSAAPTWVEWLCQATVEDIKRQLKEKMK